MTTLTEKLDAIEILMIAQHVEVLQALEAITVALGGTPTTGATLADVITAITAGTAVLSDVHLDTMSIDEKLLLIRDNVAGILAKANDATTLIGLINDDVSDVQMTIGLKAAGPENTIAFLSKSTNFIAEQLLISTGQLAGPAEGTILELLGDLRAIQADCCGDKGPTIFECDDPFKSGGLVTLPWALIGGTSQTFAVFDGIIPNTLDYGTVFGLGADETELVSADWAQWWVFVQSDQAQYSDGADGFTRHPTGEWRLMEGEGSRAFAVDARGALIVTLCPVDDYNPGGIPPEEPFIQCVVGDTSPVWNTVIGAGATTAPFTIIGGVYWLYGNDVDSGFAEISVDGVVIVSQQFSPNYENYPIGPLPSGQMTVRHIGPGNMDFRINICPPPA